MFSTKPEHLTTTWSFLYVALTSNTQGNLCSSVVKRFNRPSPGAPYDRIIDALVHLMSCSILHHYAPMTWQKNMGKKEDMKVVCVCVCLCVCVCQTMCTYKWYTYNLIYNMYNIMYLDSIGLLKKIFLEGQSCKVPNLDPFRSLMVLTAWMQRMKKPGKFNHFKSRGKQKTRGKQLLVFSSPPGLPSTETTSVEVFHMSSSRKKKRRVCSQLQQKNIQPFPKKNELIFRETDIYTVYICIYTLKSSILEEASWDLGGATAIWEGSLPKKGWKVIYA